MEETPPPRLPLRRFRWRAFAEAFHGVRLVLLTQPNAQVHFVATAGVIAMGCWLRLDRLEWAAIACVSTMVWVSEALNTALEFAVDLISPERRRLAGWAKDAAAGAVLLAALGSVVVGLLIFGPKLWARLGW